jgi:aspartate aminotransferase-like enzyme
MRSVSAASSIGRRSAVGLFCWTGCLGQGNVCIVDDAGKIVREARVASEPEARRGARLLQDEEWGTGASPERIEEALRADQAHTIKGVLIVHNETATGVTSDVAAIRRAIDAAAHPAMLYVDGVSSIASIDFRMDGWGVDLAVTGSQKG